ncbi:hypothetical protein WJX74_010192 [Apatococcus lobatus]|uniref:DNA damage-inducible protein 1 n=2 Tax=Apatococcus TaxID=904362 RepID=A0AAW1T701_9CHLO
MQLTVTTDDNVFNIDVESAETLENVKAILEVETSIPTSQQVLLFNGQPLTASTLAASGVANGDLLLLMRQQQAAPRSQPSATASYNPDGSLLDPHAIMRQLQSDPAALARLPPPVADAVRTGNIQALQDLVRMSQAAQRQQAQAERAPMGDEMDLETQARIAEEIQQKNIQENFEAAIENTPEVFGHINMLYVDMKVNGEPLKAFVDSGAQTSITSLACAERCSLTHLIDKRFSGIAKGVGTGKILGRVHAVPIQVGGHFTTMAVTVLEAGDRDWFLFGLDMLKHHQCNINLQKDVLHLGGCNVDLPFLAEHELPASMRREGKALDGQDPSVPSASGSHPVSQGPPAAAAGAAAAARAASGAAATANAPSASPAPALARPQQSPATHVSGNASPAAIQRLSSLGFSHQQAAQALQACNGNEEAAASLLFEMTGGF